MSVKGEKNIVFDNCRVLMCTHAYPPDTGGIAAFARDICVLLNNAGSQVEVYKGETNASTDSRIGSYYAIAKMYAKLLFKLKNYQPDVVLCSRLMPLTPIILFVANLFDYRVVVQVHGTELRHRYKEGWRKVLLREMYNSTDQIWANSKYTAQLLEDYGCDKDRIEVIYPFITRDAQKLAQNINGREQNNHFIIMTAAALYPRKGIDLVMRALANLKDLDWVYKIAGEPYNSQYNGMYERLADKLNITDRVTFLGQLDRATLWKEMAHADLFAMPSRGLEDDIESFGIVFIEAQQFGVPCIGSDVGGIKEAIGGGGIIIEDEDIDALTQSIKQLITDADKREKLSDIALSRVENRFIEQSRCKNIKNALAALEAH